MTRSDFRKGDVGFPSVGCEYIFLSLCTKEYAFCYGRENMAR